MALTLKSTIYVYFITFSCFTKHRWMDLHILYFIILTFVLVAKHGNNIFFFIYYTTTLQPKYILRVIFMFGNKHKGSNVMKNLFFLKITHELL